MRAINIEKEHASLMLHCWFPPLPKDEGIMMPSQWKQGLYLLPITGFMPPANDKNYVAQDTLLQEVYNCSTATGYNMIRPAKNASPEVKKLYINQGNMICNCKLSLFFQDMRPESISWSSEKSPRPPHQNKEIQQPVSRTPQPPAFHPIKTHTLD